MLSWIKRTLLWVAGGVALLFTAWMAGKRDQKQQEALTVATDYIETRKEIDNVENTLGDDPTVLRDWLRERGKQ